MFAHIPSTSLNFTQIQAQLFELLACSQTRTQEWQQNPLRCRLWRRRSTTTTAIVIPEWALPRGWASDNVITSNRDSELKDHTHRSMQLMKSVGTKPE